MGFFECTCTLTGVSLIGDATCVLLRLCDDGFAPITLPLTGDYNRLGAIDGVAENPNSQLIVDYFAEHLRTGRFVAVDETTVNETVWPAPSPEYRSVIDGLVGLVERNTTVWHVLRMGNAPMVAFDGDPIVLSLISQPVWDAIVAGSTTPGGSLEALFDKVFHRDSIAQGIYHQHLPEVAMQLRELAIVDAFLDTHGRSWTPPGDYGQHWREEILSYLERAREAYRDVPVVLDGLDGYAAEIAQLFAERGE
jgi:hypothetical protein